MILPKDPTRKFVCRTCERETNHWPICHGRVDKDNIKIDSHTYSWRISTSMSCRDCNTVTFLIDTYKGHTTVMLQTELDIS